MREALRDLLYEMPGFQALAERGIPRELISTPASVVSRGGPYEKAGESGGSRPNVGEAGSSSGTSKGGY